LHNVWIVWLANYLAGKLVKHVVNLTTRTLINKSHMLKLLSSYFVFKAKIFATLLGPVDCYILGYTLFQKCTPDSRLWNQPSCHNNSCNSSLFSINIHKKKKSQAFALSQIHSFFLNFNTASVMPHILWIQKNESWEKFNCFYFLRFEWKNESESKSKKKEKLRKIAILHFLLTRV